MVDYSSSNNLPAQNKEAKESHNIQFMKSRILRSLTFDGLVNNFLLFTGA